MKYSWKRAIKNNQDWERNKYREGNENLEEPSLKRNQSYSIQIISISDFNFQLFSSQSEDLSLHDIDKEASLEFSFPSRFKRENIWGFNFTNEIREQPLFSFY